MRVLLLAWVAAASLAACHRETPEELAQQGAEQHRAHEYAQAVELYRRSLALHPDAHVRTDLARALAAAGKFPEAAAEYRTLLGGEPQNGALWHDYGLVLESGLHDLAAAETALFNATQYPPRSPEASYDLGRVLMQRRRYEEAGACFDAAIANATRETPWLQDARDLQVQAYLLARQPR
jgi:tetratricopeptide (TPR) repeat protein